jgi:hypothetical protein
MTMRIPRELVAEMDRLLERMRSRREYADLDLTRADLIRLLLREGVRSVEAKLGRKRK